MAETRFRVVHDEDPDTSHLDMSEDEYEVNGPFLDMYCTHCGRKVEQSRTGRFFVHAHSGRIRCIEKVRVYDTRDKVLKYVPRLKGYSMAQPKELTYKQAKMYWLNPERHVYLGLILEERCDCCDSWTVKDSLWGIDFMDDAAPETGDFESIDDIEDEYLQELARDML